MADRTKDGRRQCGSLQSYSSVRQRRASVRHRHKRHEVIRRTQPPSPSLAPTELPLCKSSATLAVTARPPWPIAGNLSDSVLHQLIFQDPVDHINVLGNVRTPGLTACLHTWRHGTLTGAQLCCGHAILSLRNCHAAVMLPCCRVCSAPKRSDIPGRLCAA